MSPRRAVRSIGARVRWVGVHVVRPIDMPALLRSLAVVLLLTAVVIGLVDKREERARQTSEVASLRAALDVQDEATACRSQLATDVTDATTSYLLTMGALVVSLPGEDREAVRTALEDLAGAGEVLDDARDARVAFEENPGPCPR